MVYCQFCRKHGHHITQCRVKKQREEKEFRRLVEIEMRELEQEELAKECLGRNEGSELGSEKDQLEYGSGEEEKEEEEYSITRRMRAAQYLFEAMGENPCPAAAWHLQKVMETTGLGGEWIGKVAVKPKEYTHTPKPSQDADTQTPQPPRTRDAATNPPPPPPGRTYADVATQAAAAPPPPPPPPPPPRPTTNSVSTNTDPSVSPPSHRTYQKTASKYTKAEKGKGHEINSASPVPEGQAAHKKHIKAATATLSPGRARAIVFHGAPTKYKVGQMRRWIEEHNKGTAQILGIRWLVGEDRRTGKTASSMVIYMKNKIDLNKGLRMGRRFFRTTEYDWDR